MSETVKLLFGVHAHQPAGNFAKVVRDARDRCYAPFLEVLERHPEFPFTVHVSGWLLEFLVREFPDDVRRLRRMVSRGQAEIFGGGDTEPVLAALSEADRRGQIGAMNARIRKRFAARPIGAWLTERVWEATIVPALVGRGIRYVAVDDYHFLCTGKAASELDGFFSTEENGRRLDLFPISEALRYRIPFAPVHDVIGHLENVREGGAAIYFDDIEKFGIWPETHDWVYGRRWLEDFIEAVGRSPRIEPMRYEDYHARHRSRGVVYLPAVSYIEMGEWTLPPRAAQRLARLVERAKRESTFDEDKPFVRGGHWRNFLSRYPEANWMHRRMEQESRRFHGLARAAKTASMRDDLHLAQANDAYWHGLFGGVYLPHLRRQVYASLARLGAAIDRVAPRVPVSVSDIDLDGHDEVTLANRAMLAVARPHDGASIAEWTHYKLAHNFADTLRRREEHYFDRVRAGPIAASTGTPASIHDRLAFRTHISHDDLQVDGHPRALFVDFWQPQGGDLRQIHYRTQGTRGAFLACAGDLDGVAVAKRIGLASRGPVARYEFSTGTRAAGTFVVECDIAMPSCDGPGGAYVCEGAVLGGFADAVNRAGVRAFDLTDSELGGSLRLVFAPPAMIDARPLCTVSQSEAGFEKIMQAATIRVAWPLELVAGERRILSIRLEARSS